MPFQTIHIAKSHQKPDPQSKTCQRVWFPDAQADSESESETNRQNMNKK